MVDTSEKCKSVKDKIALAESTLKEDRCNENKARDLYHEALALIENWSNCEVSADDYVQIAESIAEVELLGDREWVREILIKAARSAGTSNVFYVLANAAEKLLGDKALSEKFEKQGDGWRDAEDDAYSMIT